MYKSQFWKNSNDVAAPVDVTVQDNAQTCYEKGFKYRYGWGGVEQDPAKGLRYFHHAAEQGHAGACYELARLYLQGNMLINITPNLERAKDYVNKGLERGRDKTEFDNASYCQKDFILQLEGLTSVVAACEKGGLRITNSSALSASS